MTMLEQLPSRVEGYRPRMSEAEFETWVLRKRIRAEWVDGEVILMAPANEDHEDISHWLHVLLGMHIAKHELGRMMAGNFMVRLPARRRVPDFLFVKAASPAKFHKTYLQGPPDLVVEIVSPDSESRDWRDKFLEYEKAGVQEYWIIDPASEQAEFYLLRRGKYVLKPAIKGVFRSHVVSGFWFKVEWLWRHPAPNVYELAKELGII